MTDRTLLRLARTARTAPEQVSADDGITAVSGGDSAGEYVPRELAFHGPEAVSVEDPSVLDGLDPGNDDPPTIRSVGALAPVHEPFVESLGDLLGDPSYRVREWAACGAVVAAASDPATVAPLVETLESRLADRNTVRGHAVDALAYVAPADDELRARLADRVRDRDGDERAHAAAAIARAVRREGLQGRDTAPFEAGVAATVDALGDIETDRARRFTRELACAARGRPGLVRERLDALLAAADGAAPPSDVGAVLGIGAVRDAETLEHLGDRLDAVETPGPARALLTGIARGWLVRPEHVDRPVTGALDEHGDALGTRDAEALRALTGVGVPAEGAADAVDAEGMLAALADAENWIDLRRGPYTSDDFARLADRDPEALLPHAPFLLDLLERDSFNVREPVAACAAHSADVASSLVDLLLDASRERGRPVAELITVRKAAQRNPERMLAHRETLVDLLSHEKPSVRYRVSLTLVPVVLAHPSAVPADAVAGVVADPHGKVRLGGVRLGAALAARRTGAHETLAPALALLRDARHEDPNSYLGVDRTDEREREWAGVAFAFTDDSPTPRAEHDTVADLAVRALVGVRSEYGHHQALAAEALDRVAPDRGERVVATLREMGALSATVDDHRS